MPRVIIDTNIWLYLAENVNGADVIGELSRLHSTGAIHLILPRTVVDEFDRNKTEAAERFHNRLQTILTSAKALRQIEGAPPDLDDTLKACRRALESAKRRIPQTIAAIDALFADLIVDEITDRQRVQAFERLRRRTPPGHGGRPSASGDCLIWECVLTQLGRDDVALC
jgi:rRNA-processing protein FCF1